MMVSTTSRDTAYLPGELSLRELLTVVFKRRWLIVAFACAVFVGVLLITLLKPPVYEVEAILLVNKSRAEIPIAPKESPQLIVSQVTEQDLNSEIQILKSRQLLEEALPILDLERPVDGGGWIGAATAWARKVMGGTQLSFNDRMVLQLQKKLKIEAIRKSNVIRVTYRSKDPELATRIVGTLTDRYLNKRAQMYQSPQALSFFEDQMREAGALLSERESALETFLASSGITMVKGPEGSESLATQKNLVMQRLARAQDELADAEVEMKECQYRVANLRQRLATEPERLQSANRFNQDAAREEIEKGIAALELERDRLLQDFKPDSRYVRDIDAQIAMARARLAELDLQGGSIGGTEVNPINQELRSELVRAEAQFEGAQGKFQSLLTQVSTLSRELDALNEKAFEFERLRRDAQSAEETYLLYQKKHEEVRISAAMDQEKLINVSVAEPAQKPLKPVSRRLAVNFVLAGLIGVLGGLGLAFGTEFYLDHTFTTGEEMERRLGLVHLASIPEEL